MINETIFAAGARPSLAAHRLTPRDLERWANFTPSRVEGVVLVAIGIAAAIVTFKGVLLLGLPKGMDFLYAVGASGLALTIAPVLAMGHVNKAIRRLFPTAARVDGFLREWESETIRRRQASVVRWQTLSGREFELALADVLKRLGYSVDVTPYSRDGGVDLVVRRDGVTWLVQCKATRSAVGVGAMRDLYGALTASSANAAVLAATSGVTSGAVKFARGKPLGVLAMKDLLALADGRDILAAMWERPHTRAERT